MQIEPTAIPDIRLLRPQVFEDSRGFFFESWNAREFPKAGLDATFVQDNISRSTRGTLRGLHYQIEQSQGKLLRAVTGTVFDVAVDLRQSSSSFGEWVGVILSDENQTMLWVPPGFAHGFMVLSDVADVLYKCTDFYAPEHERTVLWNDRDLNVGWPIPDGMEPILSVKDRDGTAFRDAELFP